MKLLRKEGKANADFNRKNGSGNGGDADRDGPDWPARTLTRTLLSAVSS